MASPIKRFLRIDLYMQFHIYGEKNRYRNYAKMIKNAIEFDKEEFRQAH